MTDREMLSKLVEAEVIFTGTVHEKTVDAAFAEYETGDNKATLRLLNQLPSQETLLRELIEKLKGKSVYKTLKHMDESNMDSAEESVKGLFSLGTHIVIECEKGRREFRMLLPLVYDKIGELLTKVV